MKNIKDKVFYAETGDKTINKECVEDRAEHKVDEMFILNMVGVFSIPWLVEAVLGVELYLGSFELLFLGVSFFAAFWPLFAQHSNPERFVMTGIAAMLGYVLILMALFTTLPVKHEKNSDENETAELNISPLKSSCEDGEGLLRCTSRLIQKVVQEGK